MLAHIAVAVTDLDQAAQIYSALGFEVGDVEDLERESVRIRKAFREGLCVELLQPLRDGEGSIARYLSKRGPGMHHMALLSKEIQSDLHRLEKQGIMVLPGYPAKGSEGSTVAFLDPKTTGGVLIELVEKPPSE